MGGHMIRLFATLTLLWVASVQAQTPPGARSIVDSRGWLTCEAFLRMSDDSKAFYLFGLRESWEVAAASIRHHAKSETIPEAVKPGMLGSANWLESMIAYPNVSHGEILKRTQIHCERPSNSPKTAWTAWLNAIAEVQQSQRK